MRDVESVVHGCIESEENYINTLAPVVIFAYNRPEHLRKTLEALKNNKYASDTNVYIYSDGFKETEAGDKEKVDEVRKVSRSVSKDFLSLQITERDHICGLAYNIIDGVTTVVNRHGKVIVLEDDIVTSPYFLKYMNDGLTIYADDQRVMEVGGFLPQLNKQGLTESFFLPWTTSWGWGTWKRSWDLFERNPEKLIENTTEKEKYIININDTDKGQWNQVIRNQKKEIYTWAVFFSITVIKNHGLVLYGNKSMCRNIGLDGSGTNCGNSSVDEIEEISKEPVLNFPDEIKVNTNALDALLVENQRKNKERKKEFYKSLPRKIIKKLFGK